MSLPKMVMAPPREFGSRFQPACRAGLRALVGHAGGMNDLAEPGWRVFLSSGARTAKIATTRADGSPHVAPVWFLLDGDDLVFNTGRGSVKGRTLARDPRVMIAADQESPPYTFVLARGTAALSEDLAQVRDWAGRIAERYVGPERAGQYAARNGVPGVLLVRVRIDHVIAGAGIAD